jgi:hypothetical protein
VKQLFEQYSTTPYLEGLSQYNGYAIWLRVISDWSGAWKGASSQHVHTISLSGKGGQVNSYGLGTLLHEVLHKNSVGGGFTHENMAQALNIEQCSDDGEGHNTCSVGIANRPSMKGILGKPSGPPRHNRQTLPTRRRTR